MKVGILTCHYPPAFGGGEKYTYALERALCDAGINCVSITSTREGNFKGDSSVIRLEPPVDFHKQEESIEWLKTAYDCIEKQNLSHLIVSNIHSVHAYFKEFIAKVKSLGVKVGIIYFDIHPNIRANLNQVYLETGSWEEAEREIKEWALEQANADEDDFNHVCDSPNFFDVDFIMSCSLWSLNFCDPLNKVPKFVLHPFIDVNVEHKNEDSMLNHVDITMCNPIYHKGRSHMVNLINSYSHNWSYRVLEGFSGANQKHYFRKFIAESWAIRDDRVDLIEYIENVEDALINTDLFFFPSRYEGYGMIPVEAIYFGKPVVALDYPAVREGLGEGAYYVRWDAESKEVIEAIEEVMFDIEDWRNKAQERVKFLKEREKTELKEFIAFLEVV